MSLLDINQEMKNRIALAIVKDETRYPEQRLKALAEIKLLILENKQDKGLITIEDDNHYLLFGAINNHDFDTQFQINDTQGERIIDFYELVDYLYHANNDGVEKYPTDVFLVDKEHVGLNLPIQFYMQAYDVVNPLSVVNIKDTDVAKQIEKAIQSALPKDNQLIDKISVYLDYRSSQKSPVSYHIVFGQYTNKATDIIMPIVRAIRSILESSDEQTNVDGQMLNIGFSDLYMADETNVNKTPIYQNKQFNLPELPVLTDDEIADNYFGLGVITKSDASMKQIYNQLQGMNLLVTTTLTNNPQVSNGNFKENDHLHFVDSLKDKQGHVDVYISNEAFDHYAFNQSARFRRQKISWQDLVSISFKAENSDEIDSYVFVLHDDRNDTIKLSAQFIIEVYDRFENKTPLVNLATSSEYQEFAKLVTECCVASPKMNQLIVIYEYDKQAGTLYFVTDGEFDNNAFDKFTQKYSKLIKTFNPLDVFDDLQFVENVDYFSERGVSKTPFYQKRKKLFGLF